MNMLFPLPQQVITVLSKLETCGYDAYVVGGSVRDYILGIEPHEFDLCSSAKPEEVYQCFANEKILDTGLQHGTVTLLIEGHSFEITTFRRDGKYSDQRHPDSVNYTSSIVEDLSRRDFTVNAMAYSPLHGFVDPFEGAKACRDKKLMAVGEAIRRFQEDPLRILRAIRLCSVLNFKIEQTTENAMYLQADSLNIISRERVASELNQALVGDGASYIFNQYAKILKIIIPQIIPMVQSSEAIAPKYDAWSSTLEILSLTPPDLSIRWAALLHLSGMPVSYQYAKDGVSLHKEYPVISSKLADECMLSLRQSKELQKSVHQLILYHKEKINSENLHYWLSKLGLFMLRKLLLFKESIASVTGKEYAANPAFHFLIQKAEELVEQDVCLSLGDLEIDGNMLIKAGFPKGPLIGKVLNRLLYLVVSGQANNNQKELMTLARQSLGIFEM